MSFREFNFSKNNLNEKRKTLKVHGPNFGKLTVEEKFFKEKYFLWKDIGHRAQ